MGQEGAGVWPKLLAQPVQTLLKQIAFVASDEHCELSMQATHVCVVELQCGVAGRKTQSPLFWVLVSSRH